MNIGWNFPRNNYGQISGIGEAGVETFRGAPFKSLAREICQNSLDARLSQNEPVRVEFSRFEMSRETFPERDILDGAFKGCTDFWTSQTDARTTNFFKSASVVINDSKIAFLRISDFNTTGLVGSDKEFNTDWCNLVKASGVSDKPGSAGGSFGIGKSAPYACSQLRTVFYSTLDKDGLRANQGVTRLVSFKIDDELTQGTGYYGHKDKNTAICDSFNLDSSYVRTTSGTDIYIAGFVNATDWEKEIILAVLDGFLVAIWKNILVVQVGRIEISKDTLPFLIEQYRNEIGTTLNYYDVLTSPDTKKFDYDFQGLGLIELYLLINPNMRRKVAVTRNSGMKIFEKGSISSYIMFAGVLVIEGKGVNELFRAMETPQHDKWEPDRHPSPRVAKRKIKELFDYVRAQLKSMEINKSQEESDAEGVGEYLPDEVESESPQNEANKEETISNKTKNMEITIVEKAQRSSGSENRQGENANEETDTVGSPSEEGANKGNAHTGKSTTKHGGKGANKASVEDEKGKTAIKKLIEIKPIHLRIFCTNKEDGQYVLMFSPSKSDPDGYVSVELSGEQSNLQAIILKACLNDGSKKALEFSNGKISLGPIIEKQPMNILFNVDYSEYCSMEVRLYGYSA